MAENCEIEHCQSDIYIHIYILPLTYACGHIIKPTQNMRHVIFLLRKIEWKNDEDDKPTEEKTRKSSSVIPFHSMLIGWWCVTMCVFGGPPHHMRLTSFEFMVL